MFINVTTKAIEMAKSEHRAAHTYGMHTAVSSGSWCGGQRQQCGDSGSGLR